MTKHTDYVGIKAHHLTFISPTDRRTNDNRIVWELICDCGEIVYFPPKQVISGNNKSCGCRALDYTKKLRGKDFTGMKYDKLTFVRKTDKKAGKNSRRYKWELVCECGNTHYCDPYQVTCGNIKNCPRCADRTQGGLSHRIYTPTISSARRVWAYYKKEGLDFDTFYDLSQQPCYYCNCLPHTTINIASGKMAERYSELQRSEGQFTYNGLDRIDSTKGHTVDNIVPCCWDCNMSKMAQTLDEFLDHIERMYAHTRRLRQKISVAPTTFT